MMWSTVRPSIEPASRAISRRSTGERAFYLQFGFDPFERSVSRGSRTNLIAQGVDMIRQRLGA